MSFRDKPIKISIQTHTFAIVLHAAKLSVEKGRRQEHRCSSVPQVQRRVVNQSFPIFLNSSHHELVRSDLRVDH
ncbi:hypothetical protein Mapa_011926 [Marchantia paleacea]|nr:hypothetical protein Mapa_011926 [Marchantia paleacea]